MVRDGADYPGSLADRNDRRPYRAAYGTMNRDKIGYYRAFDQGAFADDDRIGGDVAKYAAVDVDLAFAV